MTRKSNIFIILGIIFISFNLRAPITAVGSIVGFISHDYNLTSSMAGFITALPLLAFAVVSPFVSRISQKLSYGKTMMIGLILILIGEIIRSYTNIYGLFIGTTFLGMGIAIGNVLIPSIIKLRFSEKVGMMTSVYTTSMCIFAAVGAGSSIPLTTGLNLGWKNALAIWLALTVITIAIWIPQMSSKLKIGKHKYHENRDALRSIWKSKIAWWVTLYMGIQSLIFYSLVAWLPTIIISKDMGENFAGTMALVFQLTAIPATLIIPIICDRVRHQSYVVQTICAIYLAGMVLFLFAQGHLIMTLAVILMSLGMGGSISLSIAFISLRTPHSQRASELSGMSQSAGYLLAAIGPILMGSLFDFAGSWALPIIIFIGLIVILAICGWHAGSDSQADELKK